MKAIPPSQRSRPSLESERTGREGSPEGTEPRSEYSDGQRGLLGRRGPGGEGTGGAGVSRTGAGAETRAEGAPERGSRKSDSSRGPSTPLWGYYQPSLKALVAVGGSARRAELEPDVHELMADCFQAADEETMARGQTRWQVMIRRARKHLVEEGWIEDRAGPWTSSGACSFQCRDAQIAG